MELNLQSKRKTKNNHYLHFFGKDNNGFTFYWATTNKGVFSTGRRRDIEEIGNSDKIKEYPIGIKDFPSEMRDFMNHMWNYERNAAIYKERGIKI